MKPIQGPTPRFNLRGNAVRYSAQLLDEATGNLSYLNSDLDVCARTPSSTSPGAERSARSSSGSASEPV